MLQAPINVGRASPSHCLLFISPVHLDLLLLDTWKRNWAREMVLGAKENVRIKVTSFSSKITYNEISKPGKVIIPTSHLQMPQWPCWLCPTGNTCPWMNFSGYSLLRGQGRERLLGAAFRPLPSAKHIYSLHLWSPWDKQQAQEGQHPSLGGSVEWPSGTPVKFWGVRVQSNEMFPNCDNFYKLPPISWDSPHFVKLLLTGRSYLNAIFYFSSLYQLYHLPSWWLKWMDYPRDLQIWGRMWNGDTDAFLAGLLWIWNKSFMGAHSQCSVPDCCSDYIFLLRRGHAF